MEPYIKGATAVFRIFTHPERYAAENIREKTEATFTWTAGYLFLLATLGFLFEGKDIDETGRGGLVVLWGLSALTASVFLRFRKQTGEMKYGEGALLYLTCVAAFLTGWVLGQLITPYGQDAGDGIGGALAGGVLVYFFAVPARRMLAVLVGGDTKVGIWKFISCFVIAFAVWGTIVLILRNVLSDNLPLQHFLRKLP